MKVDTVMTAGSKQYAISSQNRDKWSGIIVRFMKRMVAK